jgi:hypothetical protein
MSIEVIASRESSVAARNPADVWLFLRVALHVSLQMLLPLKPALATGLLAAELDLFDDGRKIFQSKTLLGRLLLGRLPRELALRSVSQAVTNARGQHELLIGVITGATGQTSHGRLGSRSSKRTRPNRSDGSVCPQRAS